ncbi:hypothetical protein FDK38_000377 [Candidozyma auris]|nr:hypothetical protein FDK38_000377 [[Candida] auris]
MEYSSSPFSSGDSSPKQQPGISHPRRPSFSQAHDNNSYGPYEEEPALFHPNPPFPVVPVVPTLPYVLVFENIPPRTSHTALQTLIHSKLPPKDVPDSLHFHILDMSNGRATVEFANSSSAHAVAEALDGDSSLGSTLNCSAIDNPSLAATSMPHTSAHTPTPPMSSMNPFFFVPPMYPVDYGYFAPQVPAGMGPNPSIYCRHPSATQMPSMMPVQPHSMLHGVHSVSNMTNTTNAPGMPTSSYGPRPYGYFGGPDASQFSMGYGPGSSSGQSSMYISSYPSSRRSSTRSNSNFSRSRSSRASSLSSNRQNSTFSSRVGSRNDSRRSSLSVPARTNSSLSSEYNLAKDQAYGNSDVSNLPSSVSMDNHILEEADEDEAEEGMMTIEDESGERIEVNPCRLFVGNIPFNSTWPALKSFLISKAEEFEPNNDIEILKVEIPMQQVRDQGDATTVGSYYYLSLLSQQLQSGPGGSAPQGPPPPHNTDLNRGGSRGPSRGFAIVSTANKTSSEKLIKYFNNVEFENRPLTVRYDRFPNFNNYVLQQLYPSGRNSSFSCGPKAKPGILTNLAVERNSFQQKYYYGSASFQNMAQPYGGQFYPQNRSFAYYRGTSRPPTRGAATDMGGSSSNTQGALEVSENATAAEHDGKNSDSEKVETSSQGQRRATKMSMSDLGPPLREIASSSPASPKHDSGDDVKAKELVDFVGDAST